MNHWYIWLASYLVIGFIIGVMFTRTVWKADYKSHQNTKWDDNYYGAFMFGALLWPVAILVVIFTGLKLSDSFQSLLTPTTIKKARRSRNA